MDMDSRIRRVVAAGGLALGLLCVLPHASSAQPGAEEQLRQSQLQWQKVKGERGDSYAYSVRSDGGYSSVTVIKVKQGVVTERRYQEWGRLPVDASFPPRFGWVEMGEDVGRNANGAPAVTLDAVYEQALKLATQKQADGGQLTLSFDRSGLLQHCAVKGPKGQTGFDLEDVAFDRASRIDDHAVALGALRE